MKKMLMVLMVGILTATMSFAAKPEAGQNVTYSQLAELLVKALGLLDSLPTAPTAQQMFDALTMNGISPAEGWTLDSEAEVSTGDLARVLVQALGREDDVENPSDPKSWIKALKAMGVSLDSMSSAMASVSDAEVLPQAVVHALSGTSTDPLIADFNESRVLSAAEMQDGDIHLRAAPVPPAPIPDGGRHHHDSKPVNPTPH